MKGVTLEPGTIVTLALDGTLVFVEVIEPTYAGVVALPEQPAERSDERIFRPGHVGMKKISPFSQYSKAFDLDELSPRNQNFVAGFTQLREEHGTSYVDRTAEERAAMATKDAAANAPRKSRAERRAERPPREKKVKAGPRYLQRCTQCNEQPGHPNHPKDHEFIPPTAESIAAAVLAGGASTKAPRTPRAAKEPAGITSYTLTPGYSLDVARAQPRGDKFNEGNRFCRVVKALESLPNMTGTLEDVVDALGRDGGKAMKNPPKVARRALNLLTSEAFGSVITRAGAAPVETEESGDD